MQPIDNCHCNWCEAERARLARPRTYSFGDFEKTCNALIDAIKADVDRVATPDYVPFEPEPAQPEPVYKFVLLPYYEFGEPIIDGAEFHTAESLIEAMSEEQAKGYGFKVYKLAECIFTLDPTDNSV